MLELLAGEVVRLTEHEQLSRETVRRRLREKQIKPPGRRRCGVSPRSTPSSSHDLKRGLPMAAGEPPALPEDPYCQVPPVAVQAVVSCSTVTGVPS